jgi:dipeptidyl aminopeptidase/acylaminoacyl peptidase
MTLTRHGLPIRGCLPISGVYDFGAESGLTMRPRFLGPTGSGTKTAASPIGKIKGKPLPFFLAYGDDDFPHLIRQAERMDVALHNAGGDVRRIVMPGRTHFTASYAGGEADGPWVAPAVDWILAR